LHEFGIGGLSYRDAEFSEPEFEGDACSFEESEVRLLNFDRSGGLSFRYVYDFGDNWKHVVEFERLLALDPAPRAASCIDGARAPDHRKTSAVSPAMRSSSTSDPARWCGHLQHKLPRMFWLVLGSRWRNPAMR